MFVIALAETFRDYKVKLICLPRFLPANLPKNVSISFFTYIEKLWFLSQRIIKHEKLRAFISEKVYSLRDWLARRADAFVQIGGSLFIDRSGEPIDFSSNCPPDFSWNSTLSSQGNTFVIGANLGPAPSESYWQRIKDTFTQKKHVCLRDYASYKMMADLPHVQYAPDVLFSVPTPPIKADKTPNVVISVIDVSRHTKDAEQCCQYYRLLADVVERFTLLDIPVTLMSFCKSEGDEAAIEHLLTLIPDQKLVSVFRYRKDIDAALGLLANASFVVGSRFHSIILSLSFDVPVFPIVYNCKTKHYLDDLAFAGKWADIKNLENTNVDDVLSNYYEKCVADCSQHKLYAKNQFKALKCYLSGEPL